MKFPPRVLLAALLLLLGPAAGPAHAADTNRFELADGDRVVLIGDTLIERENREGHLEYMMTTRFPDRNITFRNLGWSADLPNGRSRVSFDWSKPEEAWFQRLLGQIREQEPTVAILGYGMAASFAGEAGLDDFKTWMTRLLDELGKISPNIRLVLFSPIRHENLGGQLPDGEAHNQQIAAYTKVIQALADQYEGHFVNFFENLQPPASPSWTLTDNGIHLTDYGYRRAAEVMAQAFGWTPATWQLGVTEEGTVREGSVGTKALDLVQEENRIRLTLLDEILVPAPWTQDTNRPPLATPPSFLQLRGIEDSLYDLQVDGQILATGRAARFGRPGVPIESGPQFEQAHRLRQAIIEKNELFFHRWRPQNSTYLFLFRKHEQGQNAAEIPQFDPLIARAEARIAELKKPVPHVYELVPASGKPVAEVRYEPSPPVPATQRFQVEEQQARPEFTTDPMLEISLWAENPMLAKPIQMNWDSSGRLWVVSSSVYPQIKPGQEANDTVLILEDTDDDGQADRSTVFAEDLLIPTGVEPGDGGAYVAQSTELLHFSDTDGDGRADRRRVVLSGFGTEDTHHILHALRWGYDGRLYMNQSIYIHSHVETPHGVVRLNSGGIMALKPNTLELGILMKGLVNTWGHHFDLYGQSFATDGAGTPQAGLSGITYVVPGAMYHTYAGARRILGSVSPGSYPKFCGLEFLYSPHFPESWQGNLVTCDFRANRVVRFALEEKDSAYVATEQPLFIRSGTVTFRPIDVKTGPDGALYIADWSNPIIQHGEVDFRDPRRDRVHGRIWRVTVKDRPLDQPPALDDLPYMKLFDHLLSANGNTRKQVRRLLLERGDDVALPLSLWLESQTTPRARLEALWLYEGLNLFKPELLKELLQADDGRVRAAAVRVLSAWVDQVDAPLELLEPRATDEHPRVRLEALRALSLIPTGKAASLALGVLQKPMDPHLDYVLWLTINDLAEPWISAIESGQWNVEGREEQLMFGLKAIEPSLAARVLDRVRDGEFPRDGSGPWLELAAKAGGVAELNKVWLQVREEDGFTPAARAQALARLEEAARRRNLMPDQRREALRTLLDAGDEQVRRQAVSLAGAWKMAAQEVPFLLEIVRDPATRGPLRRAALDTLQETGGAEVRNGLIELCEPAHGMPIRRAAVAALMALDRQEGARQAVRVLSSLEDEETALALWRELLRVKGAAQALTKALPATGLPTVMAKAGLRAAREGGRPQPELILALSQGANLDSEAEMLTEAELKAWAALAQNRGDPVRGEMIYRRTELACVTCHAIGGVGGKVGPDLTTIGASAPGDYLIESMLYPNRKVKEGYHSVVIETRDDFEYSGILVGETTDEWVVRDVLNREIHIAKSNVARRTPGNSLMPSGLMNALSEQEKLDLIRFLMELGKPGRFDASGNQVARLWQLLPNTIDLVQFGEAKVLQDDIRSGDWAPATTLVDGRLLKQDLNAALQRKSWRGPRAVYAASQFETAKAGPVTVSLEAPTEAGAWIDGQPLPDDGTVELQAGVHTLMVKLTADRFPDHIKASIDAGAFLVE